MEGHFPQWRGRAALEHGVINTVCDSGNIVTIL
jgi:hypothetical protein